MHRLLMITTDARSLIRNAGPVASYLQNHEWVVDGMASDLPRRLPGLEGFHAVWDAPWRTTGMGLRELRAPARMAEFVLRQEYDLIHVRSPRAGWFTRFGLRHLRDSPSPPLIYTAEGALHRLSERIAAPWTDHLITSAAFDHAQARRLGLVPDECLHFVPDLAANPVSRRNTLIRLKTVYELALSLSPQDVHSHVPHTGISRLLRTRRALATPTRLHERDALDWSSAQRA